MDIEEIREIKKKIPQKDTRIQSYHFFTQNVVKASPYRHYSTAIVSLEVTIAPLQYHYSAVRRSLQYHFSIITGLLQHRYSIITGSLKNRYNVSRVLTCFNPFFYVRKVKLNKFVFGYLFETIFFLISRFFRPTQWYC